MRGLRFIFLGLSLFLSHDNIFWICLLFHVSLFFLVLLLYRAPFRDVSEVFCFVSGLHDTRHVQFYSKLCYGIPCKRLQNSNCDICYLQISDTFSLADGSFLYLSCRIYLTPIKICTPVIFVIEIFIPRKHKKQYTFGIFYQVTEAQTKIDSVPL